MTKCQDMPKFQFLGGKGGGILHLKNHKVLRSALISIFGGGYSALEKSQSAKICLNFNFRGGGYSALEKSQSAKICLNFNFGGGVFCN